MPDSPDGRFPSTHWTLIARARSEDGEVARRALEELCTQYYYPLYCYIRRRGLAHHDAQDALHEFLAKLLRVHAFEGADVARGHLRSLLATALQRFLINWHASQAHRAREFSVDAPAAGGDAEERYRRERFTEEDTPERVFDRKWGHELMHRVLRRVGEKYAEKDKRKLFETLRPVLLAGGSLRGEASAQLAAAMAMSEGALRVALSRMLQDYRATLEEEVAQTVDSPADIEQEIAHLLTVFQRG